MAKYEDRINEIEDIVSNPKRMLNKYMQEGKKVIGCFPVYTPEEIVHAADMIPFGIWGGQTELLLAKTYLPAFACSIMQSNLELGLKGVYDGLSAVIIPVMCDTFRCITQNWKSGVKVPMIAFTHPQNRASKASVGYLVEEYKHVKVELEKIKGSEISDEKLNKSIEVYNEHNKVMREFAEIANKHLDIITPNVRHNIMKSAFFVEKGEHTIMVQDIIDGLNELPEHNWKGKRVVLTGIIAEPKSFLDIFEDNNIAIVGDDLAQEMRQYRTDIPEGDKGPLDRLSRQWQDRICSLAHSKISNRGNLLIDLVKKGEADGVIVCLMKFCDPEEYDYPIYHKQLNDAKIPSTIVEIDMLSTNNEQARTRIQTFAEMLI